MMTEENQWYDEVLEPFVDVSKTGKERDWKGRRLLSLALYNRLDKLGYLCAKYVKQCADIMEFVEDSEGYRRLKRTWFCKNKLCAMCNWRRSLKYSYQAGKVVDRAIEKYPKARFLFLTLTVKNVPASELNGAVSEMAKSFHRLFRYKKVDKNILGFLRATEVTRNKKTGEYHPHLHVLLMVKPTYFKNKENYITQKEWSELWQKASKVDYVPVVNIKAVKPDEDKGLVGAIKETAKYPVKPFDLEGASKEMDEEEKTQVTGELYEGLYRKRQISFGKLFKELKKELELDDVEEGDLVNVDGNEGVSEGKLLIVRWDYLRENYYIG